ncbi:LPS-assembly protein LptD [Candidatus Saganbacteria bacterium]|nr:LPS-assembly protein LptD [Candidatus Saganbacteria bacterium]
MRKLSFVIGYWTLVILTPALAQSKDVVINGNNVIYDKTNSLVEAAGSVEVKYKDVKITGQNITYNTKLDRAWADRGFVLSYNDITIEGQSLDYKLKERKGTATDIHLDYQGIDLSGRRVLLSPAEFNLQNASFSTCNLTNKHYHVTATDVVFYPEYGWLVAYWGYFWLGPVPLVPMPTYIYDLAARERERGNIPPFPEIGANDEDGAFLNERLAWYLRRELSGNYSLSYAAKKGFGGGVETDYVIDENNRGNVRLNFNNTDQTYGGMTHSWYFGPELNHSNPGAFNLFRLPKKRQMELISTLSYHERINYQRVSFYPGLNFYSRNISLLRPETMLDIELSAGMIAERYNIRLARYGAKFALTWDLPETAAGKITPTAGWDGRFYSNSAQWGKLGGGLRLDRKIFNNVDFNLGYNHYFLVQGASPFNFEMYRFRLADRLTSTLSGLVGETMATLYVSYYLDTWQPEDIDYALRFRMHCYNLSVKYRSMRREFELGFSLAGNY